jgi:hypothetical protein
MIVGADGVVRVSFRIPGPADHLQIGPSGEVWVSFGDQGRNRVALAAEALVCFSRDLEPTFRFNQVARQRDLPLLYVCYALNVNSDGDVYAYYYPASAEDYFPLARIRDNDISDFWQITTAGAHALIVDGTRALLAGTYEEPQRLTVLDLASGEAEEATAVDQDGRPIPFGDRQGHPLASRSVWGRGNVLYLLDARGVWAITVPMK